MDKTFCPICGTLTGYGNPEQIDVVCGNHTGDEINAFFNPPTMDSIRRERDKLLKESDWTQLADSPLSNEERLAYTTYRQALRDLPRKVDLSVSKDIKWPKIESVG